MANLILTEDEDCFLQSILRTQYEDDRIRSLEGPLFLSLINKIEAWPGDIILTDQENRRLQVMLESYYQSLKPYPYPFSPLTFGQDTRLITLINSILTKVEAGY